MRGIITGRDALKHLHLIAWEFGFGCAYRVLEAVVTGKKTTFLEVVFDDGTAPTTPASGPGQTPTA